MPIYVYEHPETQERVELVQRMTEPHTYIKDGIEWRRVFESPNAAIDSFGNLDSSDRAGFVKQTAKRGMTVGDMWDESAKLSEKRAKKFGKDPVKEKAVNDYKKKCGGKSHPLA